MDLQFFFLKQDSFGTKEFPEWPCGSLGCTGHGSSGMVGTGFLAPLPLPQGPLNPHLSLKLSGHHLETSQFERLDERLWPIYSPWKGTLSRPGPFPQKGASLLLSRGEIRTEEELYTGLWKKKAERSAGRSWFCFVFIFKPWRGEKKSQWGICFHFCVFSFHSFPSPFSFCAKTGRI